MLQGNKIRAEHVADDDSGRGDISGDDDANADDGEKGETMHPWELYPAGLS